MMGKEEGNSTLEWRINFRDGTSETLVPETRPISRILLGLTSFLMGYVNKIVKFLEKAWSLAVAEPQKVIHGVKVGLALSFVSLFYYMRPLYDGVGGNAMWAVMTVVVVFESTVGATLSKCINRTIATFVAGLLGVGVHWLANESGDQLEPIILGTSVFLFASAATFSRFIPSVKARFDYGAMIFILTFSLVSVSGYRTDKLIKLACHRLSTIAIGTSLCIIIGMLVCPIWAGSQLHNLICHNLGKLSDSLEGCVAEYFNDNEAAVCEEDPGKQMQGYKCVLNSKAAEDSLANFARWEPVHGRFNFRHPWKQYLKVGASMRHCAYCIETLNACVNSEIQAPSNLKMHLKHLCMKLSSSASNVLKELAITMTSMTKSSKIDFLAEEMNFAVQELQNTLKSAPNNLMIMPSLSLETLHDAKGGSITKTAIDPLMEVLQVATLVSLLIENATRIEGIVDAVEELAVLAEFKPATDEKPKQITQEANNMKPTSNNKEHENMKALPEV